MSTDVAAWTAAQEKWATQVVDHDMPDNRTFDDPDLLIGGFDISFVKEDPDDVCVGMVVCTRGDAANGVSPKVVHEDYLRTRMTVPYVAGYLGMREVPHYLTLLARCPARLRPDIAMVDGNGVLHHRAAGSATQFGILAGLPTIGVAKTLLAVDGLDEHAVRREFKEAKFGFMPLEGDSGRIWGAAVGKGTPVYVSVGHRVSIETAVSLTTALSLFKIPEPIRQADIRTRAQLVSKKQKARTGCI
jgi:deoxyinosine 3'endonuclease (endonuclease V)